MNISLFIRFQVLLLLLFAGMVWMALIHQPPLSIHVFEQTLIQLKLPRILLGMTTGALFAVSGAMLQDVMKNRIASPDILGMSAISILAVLVTKIAIPDIDWSLLGMIAFLGALCGFLLLSFLSCQNGRIDIIRFVLMGTAIGIAAKAGMQWILQHSTAQVISSLSYMSGSTYGASWERVTAVSVPGAVLFLFVLLNYRSLTYFSLSDESAKSIGFNLSKARGITILLTVCCVGTAVMGIGNLGFAGLVAPNIARLLCRHDKFWFLVFSALIGMVMVVMADALASTIFYPVEVPVGVSTTIIGAPYFLWLLRKHFQGG